MVNKIIILCSNDRAPLISK